MPVSRRSSRSPRRCPQCLRMYSSWPDSERGEAFIGLSRRLSRSWPSGPKPGMPRKNSPRASITRGYSVSASRSPSSNSSTSGAKPGLSFASRSRSISSRPRSSTGRVSSIAKGELGEELFQRAVTGSGSQLLREESESLLQRPRFNRGCVQPHHGVQHLVDEAHGVHVARANALRRAEHPAARGSPRARSASRCGGPRRGGSPRSRSGRARQGRRAGGRTAGERLRRRKQMRLRRRVVRHAVLSARRDVSARMSPVSRCRAASCSRPRGMRQVQFVSETVPGTLILSSRGIRRPQLLVQVEKLLELEHAQQGAGVGAALENLLQQVPARAAPDRGPQLPGIRRTARALPGPPPTTPAGWRCRAPRACRRTAGGSAQGG